MSLIGDLQEAKKLWSESSWLFRGPIIFAAFLVISPFASLSEVFFQWKGLFLDAINFYKGWVVIPILEFAAQFGFTWSPSFLDFIFIWSMFCAGSLRLLRQVGSRKILGITTFIVCITGFLVYAWEGIVLIPYVMKISLMVMFFCLYLWLPLTTPLNSKEKFAYWAPGLLGLTAVLILGALNAGLSR